jgi:hypothetical protein
MKYKLMILFSVMFVLLAACQNTIILTLQQGSGSITTQERPISHFSAVQINLGADLVLTQGDTESLSIEADENLMQYIQTEVLNGKLIVSKPNDVSLAPSRPIRLSVGFTTLDTIEVFGASAITADHLDLDKLTLSFNGSGSTYLVGRVETQAISIRGQATLRNFDLMSRDVSVDIKGTGTVEVSASDTLNVTVEGMGNIRYSGSPQITQNISGTGTISQK